MTTRRDKRWLALVLGAVLVGSAFAIAAANALSQGQLLLAWRYRLQSWLDRWAFVAELRVFEAHNPRMFLDPDDVLMSRVIRTYGVWEAKETAWILRCLRDGDTFVDVGANIGYYSMIAADAVGTGGRVVAFEPDPTSRGTLHRNIRLNGFTNVTVDGRAVSDQRGSLTLYLAAENKGDHRIYPGDEPREAVRVEAVTLDGYFSGADRRVDVLKVDVQGAEIAVLRGAAGLLEANPGIRLVVEFSPSGLAGLGATGEELLDFLAERDFVWFDLGISDTHLDQLEPVSAERLLQQHTVANESYTNLLAVRGLRRLVELRSRHARQLEALQLEPPEVREAASARAREEVAALFRQLVLDVSGAAADFR